MGMDMNAYVLDEVREDGTKVYGFAPIERFNDVITDDKYPSIRLTTQRRAILNKVLGVDFGPGEFSFEGKGAIDAFFKLEANASYAILDLGLDTKDYKLLIDFFRVCINNNYYIGAA